MTARVLVVEDDEDIRHLVVAHLTRAGHAVKAVASGSEAVAVCGAGTPPDLLVLDVGLPDTSGFDLIGDLRALPSCAEVPAVFLSARVQEADIALGRSLGAVYLTKPFVASALLGKIDELLREARAVW